MKNRLFVFAALIALGTAAVAPAQVRSSHNFKYNMHQLLDNYNNAWVSAKLKKTDVAVIYLKRMLESIDQVRTSVPDTNADGSRLDREQFNQRLNLLNNRILEMKIAVERMDEIKQPSREILSVCIGCHSEVKLQYLFKTPVPKSLFAEYMHKMSEHVDMARIFAEGGNNPRKVEENLKLVEYFISLLEETFPEKGPSGIVMSRADFDSRLAVIKKKCSDMLKPASKRDISEIEGLRQSFNSFCVICHEPERIK